MQIFGIPIEFFLFGITLAGVGVFHHHALPIALTGLGVILAYTAGFTPEGTAGLVSHFGHEWVLLANLMLLLTGFALLSNQFETSQAPEVMPAFLPDNWFGGFVLLVMVFALSIFLDNIAGAIIGGVVAKHVYEGRVSVGYVAAIVAASNAGGAGSVLGDTTTTMMWISGVSPVQVADAFLGAGVALLIFGLPAALQQQRFSPIERRAPSGVRVDRARLAIVGVILLTLVATNIAVSAFFPHLEATVPALGLALWVALVATALVRRPDWGVLPAAALGATFLVALVAAASLMPVDRLPTPSWPSTLGIGFVAAVFDNIPLTALALQQGGYDWGLLAYSVGIGGSMIWFGSSAGVAITSLFPEARSTGAWIRQGWAIPIAFVVGFFVTLAVFGWRPT
ncbi:MAG: citrate transporter [Caulobacterales bacterium 32-69-10]|nr:MAG: citrate transporter [Caulobacterales bacterium 32-69-10]